MRTQKWVAIKLYFHYWLKNFEWYSSFYRSIQMHFYAFASVFLQHSVIVHQRLPHWLILYTALDSTILQLLRGKIADTHLALYRTFPFMHIHHQLYSAESNVRVGEQLVLLHQRRKHSSAVRTQQQQFCCLCLFVKKCPQTWHLFRRSPWIMAEPYLLSDSGLGKLVRMAKSTPQFGTHSMSGIDI